MEREIDPTFDSARPPAAGSAGQDEDVNGIESEPGSGPSRGACRLGGSLVALAGVAILSDII
jgi:hypothetical protein